MTVAELKQALSKFPDDMKVKASIGTKLSSLVDVSWCISTDTDRVSVLLIGKEKK